MAKFQYDHPHTKHLTLQGEEDEKPWAHFQDGIFETDDPEIIARVEAVEGVTRLDEPEQDAPEGEPEGDTPAKAKK